MVTSTFAPDFATRGENLLRELDNAQISVDSALWFFFPDEGFWKLVLALPEVEKEGPKTVYGKVQKILAKLPAGNAPRLEDIAITKPNHPLLILLRTAIRTGPGISGIRFTSNIINGQLIPDAYIYRLN